MLGGAHLGKLPIEPSQLGEQVGAIVLDRGHHVVRAALLDQAPGGVVVRNLSTTLRQRRLGFTEQAVAS